MRPNISEFSYGYAITEELVHWQGTRMTAAPVFPSLYQEGQAGGGWDVMLKRGGIPLFLQFKLSDCMTRQSAYECQQGWFYPPFYRMHVRPARFSDQHEMLLDLEKSGEEVYYSAPAFHEPWELDQAYISHQVKQRSIWIRPSFIGPLPDIWDHHVAFQQPGVKRFCSESWQIKNQSDFESFTSTILSSIKKRGKFALKSEALSIVSDHLAEIARKRRDISTDTYEAIKQTTKSWSYLERLAFYASMFLGVQLFVVNELA
jgi:hypothetical protein